MRKFLFCCTAFAVLCSALSAQQYYTGDGGKSLGGVRVGEIKGTGLSGDEPELLPLIQMTLGNDFQKFAGITVPTEDSVLSVRYTLTGTVSKTSGKYRLTFNINDSSSGTQKTSYGPKECTKDELTTLKGIKAASEELITGMGVTLTQAGKTALRAVATNEAETANNMAKGDVAKRNGDTVAAQMLYYQAAELDPSQVAAANRAASIAAANINTGSVGDDTRNDIKWRNDWVKTLTDTEKYFENFFKTFNQPYALVYDPTLTFGDIDWNDNTRPFSFTVELRERANWTDPILKTVQNVQQGLNNTGRKKDWGLKWPSSRVPNYSLSSRYSLSSSTQWLSIAVELVNAKNKVIGEKTFSVRGDWDFSFDWNTGDLTSITTSTSPSKERPSTVTFNRVKADDITGNLTLRFVSVNDVPVATAAKTGLLMITLRSEYYDAAGFNDEGWTRDGYDIAGFNKEGRTRDGYDRKGFDREGRDRDGYSKDGYDRNGFNKEGYDRNGYDKDGYNRNGLNRDSGLTKDGDKYGTDGRDKDGYNKDGYGRDGFNVYGVNSQGQTRAQVEKATAKVASKKASKENIARFWGKYWYVIVTVLTLGLGAAINAGS